MGAAHRTRRHKRHARAQWQVAERARGAGRRVQRERRIWTARSRDPGQGRTHAHARSESAIFSEDLTYFYGTCAAAGPTNAAEKTAACKAPLEHFKLPGHKRAAGRPALPIEAIVPDLRGYTCQNTRDSGRHQLAATAACSPCGGVSKNRR